MPRGSQPLVHIGNHSTKQRQVAGYQFTMSHYKSHVAYFHWSTSIASTRNTDTWQAMAKPPQHHTDTWQHLKPPHHLYMPCGSMLYSHLTRPYAIWQHHTRPHQTDSATWHCLIGPCQQVGPTTAETATKWVPPECHVAICYLATSSPHATWHHHINAYWCVIFSVIAMCQALIRPLSSKPMTPQHKPD
jgi:hypothetical protein